MAKFRKKPVVIEAMQYDGQNGADITAWAHLSLPPEANAVITQDYQRLRVRTLEGPLFAAIGDWIIRGVKGEFYPCKPDIFAATYEAVE